MRTISRVSIKEYLAYEAPEGFRDELIEGEIVLSPDPKPLHAEICKNLCFKLGLLLDGTNYVVQMRTNVMLEADDSMPNADVFVIHKHRWATARDANKYAEGSPGLPIEIYSPSDRPGRLHKKIAPYLRNGAWSVWVVYPEFKTVVVHDPSGAITEHRADERIGLPGPLSAITLPVQDIFQLANETVRLIAGLSGNPILLARARPA